MSMLARRQVLQVGKRWLPPGLWEGPPQRRWVALTFDDGPDPELTPRLLDRLGEAGLTTAFFFIGQLAERYPELVCRAHAEGHAVGNHTWTHKPLSLGACRSPAWEVGKSEELLENMCPGSDRIFRPPFGMMGPGGPGALRKHGLVPVYWSIVPGDGWRMDPDEIRRRVMQEIHPGALVVLHAGSPEQRGAVDALPELLAELRAADYEVVGLPRMLEAAGLGVGKR